MPSRALLDIPTQKRQPDLDSPTRSLQPHRHSLRGYTGILEGKKLGVFLIAPRPAATRHLIVPHEHFSKGFALETLEHAYLTLAVAGDRFKKVGQMRRRTTTVLAIDRRKVGGRDGDEVADLRHGVLLHCEA
jgi:hypothetical protein